MGKLKEKTFDIFKDYKKIILYIITFIVLYCTLMTGIITRKYDLKVGDIPKSDIKAHREIIDEYAEREFRFITAIPTSFSSYGSIKTFDLVFEIEIE